MKRRPCTRNSHERQGSHRFAAEAEKSFRRAHSAKPKVLKTIKDHGGRFIVRNDQVTGFVGDAPKRIVITGWESIDDVKKWQASKEYVDLKPLRDASVKTRSFAVATCENPQGAKAGQTKCPF
jgi:uncharacterized protein (DUF1330 family)